MLPFLVFGAVRMFGLLLERILFGMFSNECTESPQNACKGFNQMFGKGFLAKGFRSLQCICENPAGPQKYQVNRTITYLHVNSQHIM